MTQRQPLLAEYAATGSETSFRELVSSYLGLVYSAALRLVDGDAHLAQDIAQTVFADLARKARSLPPDVMLGGWLHRHTCFVASNTLRAERRRLDRERQAVAMNTPEDHSAENLAQLAPVLDEAINELGAEDRTAILLRFFEQHDFRSIGTALGNSEEAARKRVDRALEKLQGLLRRRGVVLSVTLLGSTLATHAVSAAPTGLALTISTAALAGAATATTTAATTSTLVTVMNLTKVQVAIIGTVLVTGIAIPLALHQRAQSKLNAANAALQKQTAEAERLAAEAERLSQQLAQQTARPAAAGGSNDTEVLRLRGEVGKLRQDVREVSAAKTNGPSTMSGLTSNPEMYKMIRTQQKAGMSKLYQDLTNRVSLSPEQIGTLNEMLADHVMTNIDHITEVLRDRKSDAEMDAVFTASDAAMREKVRELMGDQGLAQYDDYTKNLAAAVTAEQFKSKLSGEPAERDQKAKQFYALLQAESQALLAEAGLSPDYQLVPTLNFRNFASDATADRNLKLLDDAYARAAAKAGGFLSEAELASFTEFRNSAISMNRMALKVNRQMMSPGPR